ncbi:Aspartyl/glutamyl-tRNA(Asn/Gln) amidotransferase subunit C [Gammaproteobacteria bacterium]
MSLRKEDVQQIGHLARLAITDEDIFRHARELSGILEFVRQMEVVDTTGVVPMAHPQNAIQRLRMDQVIENDQRELFQSIAPLVDAGLYLVPKVIE